MYYVILTDAYFLIFSLILRISTPLVHLKEKIVVNLLQRENKRNIFEYGKVDDKNKRESKATREIIS